MSLVKVMLIGDEVPFVQTLAKRLVQRGLVVVPAYNGPEALELMAKDPSVDIVLLSVEMSGMDGMETLKRIKKTYPLVEVILMAECECLEMAITAMKLGAYDYVLKPCDVDELVAKVAQAEGKKAKQEEKILEAKLKEIALKSVQWDDSQ
ncbi:MAG: response regulator [Desulfomonilaceae bacterium]|nr:response regulator [Desulfomonilaceae bacterium]